MKCKLYDITSVDNMVGIGTPKRIERNVKDMYYNAYRIVRKVYNRNKTLMLLVVGDDTFSFTISSFATFGILLCINGNSLWVKEVI